MKRKNEDFTKPNLFLLLLQAVWGRISWLLRSIRSLAMWGFKQPFRLLYYLLNGRVPKFENTRQEEAFWRVKRRYRRRRFLTLHSTIFVLACLVAVVAVGIQFYSLQTSTLPSEELQWYWTHFRNDLLNGGLAFVIWLAILGIHTTVVHTAQNEDDELERVMEREYERNVEPDSSRLIEQYDEANFEVDSAKAKRNHRINHNLD